MYYMFTKLISLLFVFVLSVNTGFSQKKEQKLRVFCYNVQHADPNEAAKVIEKYDPDLVALQEIDVNNGRSGADMNEAAAIAEKLKMNYKFFSAIPFEGGEYGIAILSKYTIVSTRKIDLPGTGEHRVLGVAYIDIGNNQRIVFANTHMDFKTKEENLNQMQKIIEALTTESDPVVLAGDFNAEPGHPSIAFLDQHFTRVCQNSKCLPTHPNINPHNCIDHIAFKKNSPFKVSYYTVPDEPHPSDHLPVLADLLFLIKN